MHADRTSLPKCHCHCAGCVRRLPPKLSTNKFLDILDQIAEGTRYKQASSNSFAESQDVTTSCTYRTTKTRRATWPSHSSTLWTTFPQRLLGKGVVASCSEGCSRLQPRKAFCTLRDWSHPELGSSLRVSQAGACRAVLALSPEPEASQPSPAIPIKSKLRSREMSAALGSPGRPKFRA